MAEAYNPKISIADLSGKVAVVTGACSGIGKAVARQLLENKAAAVYLGDISDNIVDTVKELHLINQSACVEGLKCDVSCLSDMEDLLGKVVQKHGRLDIMCNNAGIFAMDDDLEKGSRVFRINTEGVYFGTMLARRHMDKRNGGPGGVVINIASAIGLLAVPNYSAAYAASKHAVVGLTRTVGTETEFTGVRVNAVCPYLTNTPLVKGSDALSRLSDSLGGEMELIQPKEISEVVLKIISHNQLTGACVVVEKCGAKQHTFAPVEEVDRRE